jgi:hypothetical protein
MAMLGAALGTHRATATQWTFAHERGIKIKQPAKDECSDRIQKPHHRLMGMLDDCMYCESNQHTCGYKNQPKKQRAEANPNNRAFAAELMHSRGALLSQAPDKEFI